MYFIQGIRQQEITRRLQIHQSTVSRLLKRARESKLVRFSVVNPPGIFADLEDQLVARFELKDALVVDCSTEEGSMVRDLGAAAAYLVETTVKPGTIIGISSWGRSLFALVDALHPGDYCHGGKVVQVLGGVGNLAVKHNYIYLAQRLAALIGANAILLSAPAAVGSPEARRVLTRDRSVRIVSELFEHLDLVLVGIGSMEQARLLASSGNVLSPEEHAELSRLGAVGDICFRFFDAQGESIKSPLMQRIIGIEPASLKRVSRVIGVAGGRGKVATILGALRGKWINVLVTDRRTAENLLSETK
jgi:DNA-binding transcriptional regulator LsrR (DeoR family)